MHDNEAHARPNAALRQPSGTTLLSLQFETPVQRKKKLFAVASRYPLPWPRGLELELLGVLEQPSGSRRIKLQGAWLVVSQGVAGRVTALYLLLRSHHRAWQSSLDVLVLCSSLRVRGGPPGSPPGCARCSLAALPDGLVEPRLQTELRPALTGGVAPGRSIAHFVCATPHSALVNRLFRRLTAPGRPQAG